MFRIFKRKNGIILPKKLEFSDNKTIRKNRQLKIAIKQSYRKLKKWQEKHLTT